MAAMALITDPAVVVFDEPTTALDVTTQIEVLAAFKKVIRELGTTAVYVSHDLAVVAQMADRIVVLNGGAVKENGVVAQVLDAPVDAYTRQLLAATRRPEAELETPQNVGKTHRRRCSKFADSRRVTAVSIATASRPCACSTT